MKKNKRKFVRALVCLATLSPIMTACSCSNTEQKQQTVEYKIATGNAPHGTYTLVFDDETNKGLADNLNDELSRKRSDSLLRIPSQENQEVINF